MTRSSLTGALLRLTAYVAVLAAAFGAAFVLGAAAEPVGVRSGAGVHGSHGECAARRETTGGPDVRFAAELPKRIP